MSAFVVRSGRIQCKTCVWLVDQRYLTALSKGVCGLRLAVLRRAGKREAWQRAALHHAQGLLLRALLAWAHLYLPLAAEARLRAARAAHHWRMRLLRGAFASWQVETARCALCSLLASFHVV